MDFLKKIVPSKLKTNFPYNAFSNDYLYFTGNIINLTKEFKKIGGATNDNTIIVYYYEWNNS